MTLIKSYDAEGNMILSDRGVTLKTDDFYASRTIDEVDAKDILAPEEIVALEQPMTFSEAPTEDTRLEHNSIVLKHKSTGEEYLIKCGVIPKLSDRAAMDLSGSFVTLSNDEELFIPYKKDGSVPESFPYLLMEEQS